MKLCLVCKNTYPDDYQTCPRDQTTLTILGAEIVPGTVLRGKYEVICEIGAGGMAAVYKVRHKAFQDLAAVKVVHAHFMHDPDFIKRFRNEAVVARQLKHPNAVRIDDFDYTEDGRPFIVMEFVDGLSLSKACRDRSGPWPVDRCLNIASQITEALGAAHTLGIVHRDIKPANILLLRGPNGEIQVKVLDFGIAKVSSGAFAGMTSVLTQQSLIIGTPEYMSPEQASGSLESGIDGRADLYSLGLVLYEMLTGAHPFQADTPMGMLIQQLNTTPPPPESVVSGVPPAVSALVLKTLQKDPKNRFQSAAEMLAALHDLQAQLSPRTEVLTDPLTPRAPATPVPPSTSNARPTHSAPSVYSEPAPPERLTQQDAVRAESPLAARKKFLNLAPSTVLIVILSAIILVGAGAMVFHHFTAHGQPVAHQQNPSTAINTPSNPLPDTALNKPPVTAAPTDSTMHPGATSQSDPKPGPNPEATENRYRKLMASKQYPEAFQLASNACSSGETARCLDLGDMYDQGVGVSKDPGKANTIYSEAVTSLRKACDSGNTTKCVDLGGIFLSGGHGVKRDLNQTENLYRKACDRDNAHACGELSAIYEGSYGPEFVKEPDQIAALRVKGAKLFRASCERGSMNNCIHLGEYYEIGWGVPQDYGQAAMLYRKACDANNLNGCEQLAKSYIRGEGVLKDLAQAAVLYRKACNGNDDSSCANLGDMYYEGIGVTRNSYQAKTLYRKACNENIFFCNTLKENYLPQHGWGWSSSPD